MEVRGKVESRVALVTGASSGIGAAIAVKLAAQGMQVVAVARRQRLLEQVTNECQRVGGTAAPVVGDVSSSTGAREIIEATRATFGEVSVLVNNAGVHTFGSALAMSFSTAEEMFATNYFGPVHLSLLVLPGMIERRAGSIINVTSVTAYVPNTGEAAYGSSKAALSMWTHGLAVDLAGTGVHVGVLSPGPIDTETMKGTEEYYAGRRYPPTTVAEAAYRMIRNREIHRTVPKRFGLVAAIYPALGSLMRPAIRRARPIPDVTHAIGLPVPGPPASLADAGSLESSEERA